MTSKSVHRAIPLGFREKANLRSVIGLRPDVYLHSATQKERGFRGEKTESFAFIVSTAHLIPSYFVSAQIFFVRSPDGPAIIFKAEWMDRPFSHLGIYTSAGIIFSDHDLFPGPQGIQERLTSTLIPGLTRSTGLDIRPKAGRCRPPAPPPRDSISSRTTSKLPHTLCKSRASQSHISSASKMSNCGTALCSTSRAVVKLRASGGSGESNGRRSVRMIWVRTEHA